MGGNRLLSKLGEGFAWRGTMHWTNREKGIPVILREEKLGSQLGIKKNMDTRAQHTQGGCCASGTLTVVRAESGTSSEKHN